MSAAGAAQVAGAGISAYGAIKGAQDEANFDRQKAATQEAQAVEIAEREKANEAINQSAAFNAKLDFASAYAGSGKEGAGIGSQLEIQRQTDLKNLVARRDAGFQETMLRTGAEIDKNLANSTESSGYIAAAGSLLGAAGKGYSTYAPGGKPSGLTTG